ncbi:hypothetical protein [Mesorhizobium sp.]|uniref:hypothetical protein n=1 Tax=Mesorhizobium sp. TaxID=1871066 RepID=UPI003BABDAE2
MNIRTICLCATLALSCNAALAGALDAVDHLQNFYTDSSMKKLKPMPEFKKAFMAMPESKRRTVMRECQDAGQRKRYAEFCADVNALTGMR